jgi:AcrR family transcriptional regulator
MATGSGESEEVRERILSAAIAAFATLDPSFVSIEEVTLRAKVSRRTVYLHFESLTALRYEVFDRMLAHRLGDLAIAATDLGRDDPLRDGLMLLARSMHEHRTEFRFLFGEIRRESFDEERRARIFDQTRMLWMQGHNEAHRAGTTPRSMTLTEAERCAAMLFGVVSIALDQWTTLEGVEGSLLGFLETYRLVHPHVPLSTVRLASERIAAAPCDSEVNARQAV